MVVYLNELRCSMMKPEGVAALAKFVFETRKQKGLSQPDITKRGGPSKGWLGSLEAGTMNDQPKPGTLRRLANALGVPEAEVFRAAGMEHLIEDDEYENLAARVVELEELLIHLVDARLVKSGDYPAIDEMRPLPEIEAALVAYESLRGQLEAHPIFQKRFLASAVDARKQRAADGAPGSGKYLPPIKALGNLIEADFDPGAHPLTADERELIHRAQQLRVWTTYLNEPEAFDETPEERAWRFEELQRLVDAAEKSPRRGSRA